MTSIGYGDDLSLSFTIGLGATERQHHARLLEPAARSCDGSWRGGAKGGIWTPIVEIDYRE